MRKIKSVKRNFRKKSSLGLVHKMPGDLKKAIKSIPLALGAWKDITPLAQNEFVCWVLDAKKPETRISRIERTCNDLVNGKRRPCCWMGCNHR